jgi:hypothetical protein
MSIVDEIRQRVADGMLVLREPMIRGSPHTRLVYAAPMLSDRIDADLSSEESADRMGRLIADVDHFSMGGLVTVSRGAEKHAFMKQLEPPGDEIWEIRSRDPKPSLRVFGRFAVRDVFIATHVCSRGELGGPHSRAWSDELRRCAAEWRKLFPTYPPLSGVALHDYISENVVDLGLFS